VGERLGEREAPLVRGDDPAEDLIRRLRTGLDHEVHLVEPLLVVV
jgi:hypothetical protein